MPVLDLGEVALAYEMGGSGPALTFLHGFTQRGDSWAEVIDLLPRRYTWLTLDLRGHGRTRTAPGAPHTMAACADDIAALWHEVGVDRGHVVGYSMGGRLAISLAAAGQLALDSLVAIGAHAGLPVPEAAARRAADELLAQRILADGVAAFAADWAALPLFEGLGRRGPAFLAELAQRRLENSATGLAASLRGMGAGVMPNVWDRLPSVTSPALLVAGDADPKYVDLAHRLAAALPHGNVAVLAGSSHSVHLEQPHRFAGVVADFLAGVTGPAPPASIAARTPPGPAPPV